MPLSVPSFSFVSASELPDWEGCCARGDPDQLAAVADSLRFKHRCTSGVMAWAPEYRPSDAQIRAVLNDFGELAFAGLSPDRCCWSAVLHRDPEPSPDNSPSPGS